jgi:hypothetical protein
MRFLECRAKLAVGDVAQSPPGRHACVPKRLGLPQIADPGNETLIQQSVADLASLIHGAQVPDHRVEVGRLAEDVRPETARDAAVQLEDGAVEHRADVFLPSEHEPRLPEDGHVTSEDTPASLHA